MQRVRMEDQSTSRPTSRDPKIETTVIRGHESRSKANGYHVRFQSPVRFQTPAMEPDTVIIGRPRRRLRYITELTSGYEFETVMCPSTKDKPLTAKPPICDRPPTKTMARRASKKSHKRSDESSGRRSYRRRDESSERISLRRCEECAGWISQKSRDESSDRRSHKMHDKSFDRRFRKRSASRGGGPRSEVKSDAVEAGQDDAPRKKMSYRSSYVAYCALKQDPVTNEMSDEAEYFLTYARSIRKTGSDAERQSAAHPQVPPKTWSNGKCARTSRRTKLPGGREEVVVDTIGTEADDERLIVCTVTASYPLREVFTCETPNQEHGNVPESVQFLSEETIQHAQKYFQKMQTQDNGRRNESSDSVREVDRLLKERSGMTVNKATRRLHRSTRRETQARRNAARQTSSSRSQSRNARKRRKEQGRQPSLSNRSQLRTFWVEERTPSTEAPTADNDNSRKRKPRKMYNIRVVDDSIIIVSRKSTAEDQSIEDPERQPIQSRLLSYTESTPDVPLRARRDHSHVRQWNSCCGQNINNHSIYSEESKEEHKKVKIFWMKWWGKYSTGNSETSCTSTKQSKQKRQVSPVKGTNITYFGNQDNMITSTKEGTEGESVEKVRRLKPRFCLNSKKSRRFDVHRETCIARPVSLLYARPTRQTPCRRASHLLTIDEASSERLKK